MSDRERALRRLGQHARFAGFRLRLDLVLSRATTLAVLPLMVAAIALTTAKLARGGLPQSMRWGVVASVAVLLFGALHAALRKLPPLSGALALERHHDLRGRVTNALAFAAVAPTERTPLMEAAIDDGVGVAERLSPRAAVPLRRPRGLPVVLVLAVGIVVLSRLEVPVVRVLPPPPGHVEGLAIAPDDADLLRHVAEGLVSTSTDPEALVGARRFNQIVEDLAARRLDRQEVFRRLDSLDRSLQNPAGLDAAALDEALDGVARELDKSAMSKPVAKALDDKQLADAEQAMRDLAKKVSGAKKDVDRAKLDELRKALQKSSETVHRSEAQGEQERASLEERRKHLLQKQQKEGLTPAEKQELDRAERRLERLDRKKRRGDARSEGLSGLDKDLAKAAQDLMKDLGQGADDVERGAEDLHRAGQERMSEQQKQELKRRIEELRQMLRQEGQAGRDRIKRMMKFGQQARGDQGGGQEQKPGQGQPGQGQPGQGNGQGPGTAGLTLKPGGIGASSALTMQQGGGSPGSPGNQPGGGAGQQTDEWGTGHDPNVRGDATHLKGQTDDVSAVGADTGQGSSSSQVIYGAAERGFTSRAYKKVYTDYQTVAEESLAKDEIPPGYRFYVRRYFELIRPRD